MLYLSAHEQTQTTQAPVILHIQTCDHDKLQELLGTETLFTIPRTSRVISSQTQQVSLTIYSRNYIAF